MAKYHFKLYITGHTPRSLRAIANLRLISAGLDGDCHLTVIDVLESPQVAEDQQVMATPMLVRESPPPPMRVIGDLSDRTRVMVGLDLDIPPG
jgi:circadian clock protein KaiB